MLLGQNQTHRSKNRIESPAINPYLYSQLIYEKGGKIFNGWKTDSSINGVGNTGELHAKQTH